MNGSIRPQYSTPSHDSRDTAPTAFMPPVVSPPAGIAKAAPPIVDSKMPAQAAH